MKSELLFGSSAVEMCVVVCSTHTVEEEKKKVKKVKIAKSSFLSVLVRGRCRDSRSPAVR